MAAAVLKLDTRFAIMVRVGPFSFDGASASVREKPMKSGASNPVGVAYFFNNFETLSRL